MDIVKRLNNEFSTQDFTAENDLALALKRYKGIAEGYALTENALAVLSDMHANISYMYYGGFADELGIKRPDGSNETPSIWEKIILNRIHPDDLHKKYLHELQFFHFMKRQPTSKKTTYYYMGGLRMKDAYGYYRQALHRIFYFHSPTGNSFWLSLCLYTPLFSNAAANGLIINSKTGQVQALDKHTAAKILSDRELQVLMLIEKGLMSKQIAETLSISINTVNRHRQEIRCKLNARSAIEACRVAKDLGLL